MHSSSARGPRPWNDAQLADLTIAGIARVRGLVMATRNTREFTPMGIEAASPFNT